MRLGASPEQKRISPKNLQKEIARKFEFIMLFFYFYVPIITLPIEIPNPKTEAGQILRWKSVVFHFMQHLCAVRLSPVWSRPIVHPLPPTAPLGNISIHTTTAPSSIDSIRTLNIGISFRSVLLRNLLPRDLSKLASTFAWYLHQPASSVIGAGRMVAAGSGTVDVGHCHVDWKTHSAGVSASACFLYLYVGGIVWNV